MIATFLVGLAVGFALVAIGELITVVSERRRRP